MLRSPFHVKRRTQSQYLSEADGRVDTCYHRAEESAWYFQHQKHLFSAFIFCPLRVTSFGRHTRHFHLEASTSLSSRRKKAFVHSCKQVQNLKVSCCVLLFCRRLQHLSKMTCSDYTVLRGGVGAIHRDHQMLCFSSNLGSATWLVNTARPSTEYISSKWTFIFYSSKSTLNVSCSVNSSSCSHSRSVALDHGEHQLSPSKHQTSKSHMLCSCAACRICCSSSSHFATQLHSSSFLAVSRGQQCTGMIFLLHQAGKQRVWGQCCCEPFLHIYLKSLQGSIEYLDLPLSLTSGHFPKRQNCHQSPTQSKAFTKVS